jgi:hypothetical protein
MTEKSVDAQPMHEGGLHPAGRSSEYHSMIDGAAAGAGYDGIGVMPQGGAGPRDGRAEATELAATMASIRSIIRQRIQRLVTGYFLPNSMTTFNPLHILASGSAS